KASAVALRMFPAVFTAEESTRQWTPRKNADAGVLDERHDFMFDIPAEQRVVHFRGAEARPAILILDTDGLGGAPRVPVRESDAADLAHANKIVQRFEGLLDRSVRIHPMHEVDVDVIRSKAA